MRANPSPYDAPSATNSSRKRRIPDCNSREGIFAFCAALGSARVMLCYFSRLMPRTLIQSTKWLGAVVALAAQIVCAADLDRDAVRRDLQDFSRAGMNKRFGPDYAFYHTNGTESFPNIYLPPTKQDNG